MKLHNQGRRRLSLALLLPWLARLAEAGNRTHGSDVDKRRFMESATKDIAGRIEAARRERDATVARTGAAPLFVQIPTVIPFVDWDFYYIDRDLHWAPPANTAFPAVRVPKGFVTDLASVPSMFWSKYPPVGRYAYAAIVHDYLYWYHDTTKEVADEIMVAAMRDAGTNEAAIADFHSALRLAGGFAWSANEKARKGGEKRILTEFPSDRLISWSDWKLRPNVFGVR